MTGNTICATSDDIPIVTDIDLLVMATVTPEITCPSNACFLQERLGLVNAAAFDLNAACSGFVYSTATVASMIESGVAERVLVIGAEKLHFVMDYWDRNHCILFGDGAGAAVFEAATDGSGLVAHDIGADGVAGRTMVFPTFGSRGELDRQRDPAVDRLISGRCRWPAASGRLAQSEPVVGSFFV